jgi:hypothetical protein
MMSEYDGLLKKKEEGEKADPKKDLSTIKEEDS